MSIDKVRAGHCFVLFLRCRLLGAFLPRARVIRGTNGDDGWVTIEMDAWGGRDYGI